MPRIDRIHDSFCFPRRLLLNDSERRFARPRLDSWSGEAECGIVDQHSGLDEWKLNWSNLRDVGENYGLCRLPCV